MIELEYTRRRFLTRCIFLGAAVSLPSAALARRVMPQVWSVPVSDDGRVLSPIQVATVVHSDAQWRALLGAAVFEVARRAGTEPPYSGALLEEHRAGVFRCVCCDAALFLSQTKFDSGTGWPSFWQPVAAQNVLERRDLSSGMNRVEVLCSRCEAHLGHVFDDGPPPTGLRYCMNSLSLRFVPLSDKKRGVS